MKTRNSAIGAALLFSSFFCVGVTHSETSPIQQNPLRKNDDFKAWLQFQQNKSIELLFRNISAPGAARGSVVASPSRDNPNYYFHWVRDAALVMDIVTTFYEISSGDTKNSLRLMLWDYLHFSRSNQTTENPSMAFHRSGLGEPKFNADGSAYNSGWPRPQNDGPALRTITLARFANDLLNEGLSASSIREIYDAKLPANSVVKADLEFLKDAWAYPGFDLWEECNGHHFYTRLVQYKALLDGADLAERLSDPHAAQEYRKAASLLRVALQDHWDASRGYIQENFGSCHDRDTGMDVATILAVLHSQGSNQPLASSDERILATSYELERAFTAEYPLNRSVQYDAYGNQMSPGIGRYPGDRYNGYVGGSLGNPWVLATNAFAEYYYRVAIEFASYKNISVTDINLKFFRNLLPSESFYAGLNISSNEDLYGKVLNALVKKADGYVYRVRYHGFGNGSFSEQFNRDNGRMQGASDLTWNYASFLTMLPLRLAIGN